MIEVITTNVLKSVQYATLNCESGRYTLRMKATTKRWTVYVKEPMKKAKLTWKCFIRFSFFKKYIEIIKITIGRMITNISNGINGNNSGTTTIKKFPMRKSTLYPKRDH